MARVSDSRVRECQAALLNSSGGDLTGQGAENIGLFSL